MSLQDDIYDCEDALAGTDHEESFERVYTALANFERRALEAEGRLKNLRDGAYSFIRLFKESQ